MSVNQALFRDALLAPSQPVPEGLTDGAGHPAGRRFSVYRNNVAVSLTEALELGFPVIRRLIGDENFRAVMGIFLRAHPPSSPILALYGDALPGFLEGFQPLAHLAYLPDIARLEQALRVAYHAADAPPADTAALGALPPEALLATRFRLAPATHLVASDWPIHAIWTYNTRTGAPKPRPRPETALVVRPDFDPEPLCLTPAAGAFVAALAAGATLGEAHDAGAAREDGFDLSAPLATLIEARAIAAILPGDRE
ncbi:DNA-binding domain-containing protein [Roseovarius sp. SCSIO 43702]|uniref:HvfC/BufC N-terminal domain-containing protein n=1 Tax=Roseovarius sp. SCSIO 43702 TaxID=2823043 RepID=UPI001C73733A|nr:DNA-binding domain-containing protein [Roseovarius sp. SCSIO 43702]QYX55766.1 DNA-binding domain-containing protein [Roseovarius sp. SCSIO 43702]